MAALLPPLLGGLAILVTFFVLRIVAHFVDVSVFALNFTTGLGLGLAIDYSLFMVSRYREESARLGFGAEALTRTLQTAGRTIVFSSLTIAAAIASLMVFPQSFLYSMGIAGAIVALIAATLALTVLPALLGVLGPRVNALAPRRLQRGGRARGAPGRAWLLVSPLPGRDAPPGSDRDRQRRVADRARYPVLAHQVHPSRCPGPARQRQRAPGRRCAEVTQFPPNRTSPLEVVVGAPAGSPPVKQLAASIARLPDVVGDRTRAARRTRELAAGGRAGAGTADRGHRAARATRPRDQAPVYVGVAGETASFVDLEHSLALHLPLVLAIVIGSTLIILFLFTGSVVLPIKAVLMNFLTLSAMLGILVFIFQDGHLQGLLVVPQRGRARRHPADLPVRSRVRARHRLRRVPALPDQGGPRRRRPELARRSRSGSSGPGGSSPPRRFCSRSRSARLRPRRSCSSRSSGSARRSPC